MSLYVPGAEPALKSPRRYGSKPVTAQSYEGHTTVTGTPSPDNPATLTPVEPPAVPGAARQIGPLWSLPDGTKDTYDGETGVLVRRVGKLVLDGTENWYPEESIINGDVVGSSLNFNAKIFKSKSAICSHFVFWTEDTSPYFYIWNGLTGMDLGIPRNLLSGTKASDVKAWLAAQATAGTPVTVLYELAQPVVEHITSTGPLATRSADLLAPSWEGETTVTGTPSPDNPANISGVPFRATATGPNGESHSVDLGVTGYSLPDGTRDAYDGKSGALVQRVRKLMLDGSEIWTKDTLANKYYFVLADASVEKTPICTHYSGKNQIYIHAVSYLMIVSQSTPTVDDFKSFLAAQAAAGTPVTVYYALAEPIASNRKADLSAFDKQTTVSGATSVEVIDNRILRFDSLMPFEVVRVNPNLLDNPYFADPINQRGGTEYTGSRYGIDRWRAWATDAVIKLVDGGILAYSATNPAIYQRIVRKEKVPKETLLTLSILVNGELLSVTGMTGKNFTISSELAEIGFFDYNSVFDIRIATLGAQPVYAAKLEEGPEQTLARKVGDQWVLNDPPPDPTLELLRCQRYYLGPVTCREAVTLYNKSAFFTLHTPVAMRGSPRIDFPSHVVVSTDGSITRDINVESVSQASAGLTGIYTTINFENFSVTGSKVGVLEMYGVKLSAEL